VEVQKIKAGEERAAVAERAVAEATARATELRAAHLQDAAQLPQVCTLASCTHCRGLKDALLRATEHLNVRAIRLIISRTYCFCWLQELANPLAHPAWASLERALLPAAALWTAALDQMAAATSAFVVCRLLLRLADSC